MDFYLLLTGVTIVILLLAGLVWSRTRHLSFPLGIGLIYYWSLFGAWSIVQDRLGGERENGTTIWKRNCFRSCSMSTT